MWEEAMHHEKSPGAGQCVGQNALQPMYFKHPPQHGPQRVTHAPVQNMHLKQNKYFKKITYLQKRYICEAFRQKTHQIK